jgi:hypothetical protein
MAEPKSAGECVITIITCVCVHVPHIQWRCFPLLWTCAYRQVDMFRHPAQLLRGCITVSCPSGYHLFPVRLLHAYMLIGTLVGMIKLRPHPYIHAPHPRPRPPSIYPCTSPTQLLRKQRKGLTRACCIFFPFVKYSRTGTHPRTSPTQLLRKHNTGSVCVTRAVTILKTSVFNI